jgi:hypothetical protein
MIIFDAVNINMLKYRSKNGAVGGDGLCNLVAYLVYAMVCPVYNLIGRFR